MKVEGLNTTREWWSQRWLDLLNSYRFKKRLERARNYARQGKILSIEFKGTRVIAKVQGSELEPYRVSIFLDTFTEEEWGFVVATMASKAIFAAQLLAGEMPQNIEDVFAANGLSLFPFTLSDIHSECSCPDTANPCKHIGAVYYRLSDCFSEDPFILFQLRGCTKEQIISNLRLFRSIDIETTSITEERAESEMAGITTLNINDFWKYNQPLESSLVVIAPSVGETVLDVLGKIPLPNGNKSINNITPADVVMKFLYTLYKDMSQTAMLVAMNAGRD
ncbi:hypothetical protein RINTHH_13350 [Richelia intracellularis HH01]|mgnify:FL=1|uniref:SWIM-type domain-containing protein n=1 Tax=Richelia intracellularis HH01 TaxID=1165094 RepID=M1X2V6_9NOST|nr:SWIM zinc finger family protein [Richelia intracellularis]CCH67490.1 hypothetical protein RINTHH_13350 [Richelia intracellularis HH01]